MQLLSPTQVKNISREVANSEKRTLADLTLRIFEKTRELNTLSADIERAEKMNQERTQERNKEIVALNEQIAVLEATKKRLMVPIDAIKANLETQIAENSRAKHVLTQGHIFLNEQREKLFVKTEELTDFEQLLNERQEKQESEKKGLDRERKELKRISDELQTKLQTHTQNINDINVFFQSKQNEIAQQEHALHIKELTFAQQQEEWENIKETEKRQLADQRATLERALKRIKK